MSGVCQRPFQCCSGVAEAVLFHEHEAEVVLDLGELNFGRRLQISVAGSSIERLCLQKPAAAVVDVAQVLVDLASRQQVAVLVESVARGHPAGDRFVVAAKHSQPLDHADAGGGDIERSPECVEPPCGFLQQRDSALHASVEVNCGHAARPGRNGGSFGVSHRSAQQLQRGRGLGGARRITLTGFLVNGVQLTRQAAVGHSPMRPQQPLSFGRVGCDQGRRELPALHCGVACHCQRRATATGLAAQF